MAPGPDNLSLGGVGGRLEGGWGVRWRVKSNDCGRRARYLAASTVLVWMAWATPPAQADAPGEPMAPPAAGAAAPAPVEGDDDGDAPGSPPSPSPTPRNDAESALGSASQPPPAVAPVIRQQRADGDSAAAVPVVIRFRNDVGAGYRLIAASFQIDGHRAQAIGSPGLHDMTAFSGSMPPGPHLLTAELRYQGKRRGPFSYMQRYHFNVQTTGAFVVPAAAGATAFTVVSRERRGANTPPERRMEMVIERIATQP